MAASADLSDEDQAVTNSTEDFEDSSALFPSNFRPRPHEVLFPPVIGLCPDEVELVAEGELVGIVPHFNFGKMCLISGDLGPFRAGLPITVPLWLAVLLCKTFKCRVLMPDWFDVTILTELKDNETKEATFIKMPSKHYMIVAKQLFELCPGEIKNAEEVKTLIKDIWDIRMSKLRTSIKAFLGGDQTVGKIDNLTMMEISTIRPFFPHALDQIYRLTKTLNSSLTIGDSNSQDDSHNFSSMSMSADSGLSQSQSQSSEIGS